MRSAGDRSNLLFPIVLAVTGAVTFLPAPARLGWQRELAQIVRLPLRPFSHFGSSLGGWLRPAPTPSRALPADQDTVNALIEERDVAMRRMLAAEQEVRALKAQIAELQRIPPDIRDAARTVRLAYVTRRQPLDGDGTVELTMQRGARGVARAAVPTGAVAVYRGVHLLGRTVPTDDPVRTTLLLPLTRTSTGYVQANLYPKSAARGGVGGVGGLGDRGVAGPGAASSDESERGERTIVPDGPVIADFVLPGNPVLIQLLPDGSGRLTADVDRTLDFDLGDAVRLNDARWPRSAQQLVIGRVVASKVKDSEPLRRVITVEPYVTIADVATVMLLADDLVGADDGAADAGGATP